MNERISAFLDTFILGTISTVTPDNKPEAAYVGFTHSKNLEMIIGTSNLTRKYQNIQQNPHVAMVIASTEGEVQYEGVIKEITQEEYNSLIDSGMFKHLPGIEKYRSDPHQVYLRITPTWVRFIQHDETDAIEEITEFDSV